MSYVEKFWRDAKVADVARVMEGETVKARFSDDASGDWKYRALIGWSRGGESDEFVWASTGLIYHRYCQVYDPPQWYLDKPDPGEGYRLLEKFPDEPVQGGDFIRGFGGWIELANGCNPKQGEGIWYRRKIDQPKPEPKHYVLQVGDTVELPDKAIVEWLEKGVFILREYLRSA